MVCLRSAKALRGELLHARRECLSFARGHRSQPRRSLMPKTPATAFGDQELFEAQPSRGSTPGLLPGPMIRVYAYPRRDGKALGSLSP